MNKAVIYTRVSTVEQVQGGVSLKDQEAKLLQYCQLHDIEVVKVVREEGISAGKPLATRPGGRELLQAVASGGANHVVALKLDRLFRDASDALAITQEWDKAKVNLHLVDYGGQTLNTASAMGRFFLNTMAGLAELERNLTSERTASALQYKKSKREAYGSTPYGYNRDGDNLVINDSEQQTIELIKLLRADGLSLGKIATTLNDKGAPTKQGGKWFASTVSYILNNKLYSEVA